MTHLELENVTSDYLEGLLDAVRRAEVEEHLAACPDCAELVQATRQAMALCRSAEELEPAPWLVSKILRATAGERKPTWWEQVTAFLRPAFQARVAYVVGMVVFSFSIIINAAGISLRHLKLEDLNPRTWVYQVKRNGNLLYGRAEKFCYDLKVVYEIESRLRQLRPQTEQSPSVPVEQAPKPATPEGGSSTQSHTADEPQLALLIQGPGLGTLRIAGGDPSPRSTLP